MTTAEESSSAQELAATVGADEVMQPPCLVTVSTEETIPFDESKSKDTIPFDESKTATAVEDVKHEEVLANEEPASSSSSGATVASPPPTMTEEPPAVEAPAPSAASPAVEAPVPPAVTPPPEIKTILSSTFDEVEAKDSMSVGATDNTSCCSTSPSRLKAKKDYFENVFKKPQCSSPVRSPTRRAWSPRHKKSTVTSTAASPSTQMDNNPNPTAVSSDATTTSSAQPQTKSMDVSITKHSVMRHSTIMHIDTFEAKKLSHPEEEDEVEDQNVSIAQDEENKATAEVDKELDGNGQKAPETMIPANEETPLLETTENQENVSVKDTEEVTESQLSATAVPRQKTGRPTPIKTKPTMDSDVIEDDATGFSDLQQMWGVKAADSKPLSPENDAIVAEAEGKKISKVETSAESLPISNTQSVDMQEEKKEEPEETQVGAVLSTLTEPGATTFLACSPVPPLPPQQKTPKGYAMTPRTAMASESPRRYSFNDHGTVRTDGRKTPMTPSGRMSFDPTDTVMMLRESPSQHTSAAHSPATGFAASSAHKNDFSHYKSLVGYSPKAASLAVENYVGTSTPADTSTEKHGLNDVSSHSSRSSPTDKDGTADQNDARPKTVVTSPALYEEELKNSGSRSPTTAKKPVDDTESTADETALLEDAIDRAAFLAKTAPSAEDADEKSTFQATPDKPVDNNDTADEKYLDKEEESDDDDFGELREQPRKVNAAAINTSAASLTNHARRSMEKYQAMVEITQQYCPPKRSPNSGLGDHIKKFEAFSRGANVKNDSQTDDDYVEVEGGPRNVNLQEELKKLNDIVTETPAARSASTRRPPSPEEVKEEIKHTPNRFSFYTSDNDTLTMLEHLSEPNPDAFEEVHKTPEEAKELLLVKKTGYVPNVVKAIEAGWTSANVGDDDEDEDDDEIVRVTKKAAAAVRDAANKLSYGKKTHTTDELKKLPARETPGPSEAMGYDPDCSMLTDTMTTAAMDTTLALDDDVFDQGMALVGSVDETVTRNRISPSTIASSAKTSPKYNQPITISRSESGQAVDQAKCGECVIL